MRFDSAFLKVEDIEFEMWTKLIFNAAWNPVSALTGLDTHHILSTDWALRLIYKLSREIEQVAVACEVKLPGSVVEDTISTMRKCPSTMPSMLQDAQGHRQMEIEALSGECCTFDSSSSQLKDSIL